MGVYNEFYVFANNKVIPVAHFSIYNRNVGGFSEIISVIFNQTRNTLLMALWFHVCWSLTKMEH